MRRQGVIVAMGMKLPPSLDGEARNRPSPLTPAGCGGCADDEPEAKVARTEGEFNSGGDSAAPPGAAQGALGSLPLSQPPFAPPGLPPAGFPPQCAPRDCRPAPAAAECIRRKIAKHQMILTFLQC